MAITAGMDYAQGDVIVIIDADLQDPPELIPEMVNKWQEGNDIVYARRKRRLSELRTWKTFSKNLGYNRPFNFFGDQGQLFWAHVPMLAWESVRENKQKYGLSLAFLYDARLVEVQDRTWEFEMRFQFRLSQYTPSTFLQTKAERRYWYEGDNNQ